MTQLMLNNTWPRCSESAVAGSGSVAGWPAIRTGPWTGIAAAGAARAPATVTAIEYLGTIVNIAVELADGREVSVTLNDSEFFKKPFETGQPGSLSWSSEDAHELAA